MAHRITVEVKVDVAACIKALAWLLLALALTFT